MLPTMSGSTLTSTERRALYSAKAKRGEMLKQPVANTRKRVAYLAQASAASQVAASIGREAANAAMLAIKKSDIVVNAKLGAMERVVIELNQRLRCIGRCNPGRWEVSDCE